VRLRRAAARPRPAASGATAPLRIELAKAPDRWCSATPSRRRPPGQRLQRQLDGGDLGRQHDRSASVRISEDEPRPSSAVLEGPGRGPPRLPSTTPGTPYPASCPLARPRTPFVRPWTAKGCPTGRSWSRRWAWRGGLNRRRQTGDSEFETAPPPAGTPLPPFPVPLSCFSAPIGLWLRPIIRIGVQRPTLRLQHAKPLPGRRFHHPPPLDVGDLLGAQRLQPRHLGLDVVGLDVEVHPALATTFCTSMMSSSPVVSSSR